jgi:hypothetical protein
MSLFLSAEIAVVRWCADQARKQQHDRQKVSVLAHRAYLSMGPECYFMKVVNLSKDRDIAIADIWYETNARTCNLSSDRPLTARLRPDETFETWVPVADLPEEPDAPTSSSWGVCDYPAARSSSRDSTNMFPRLTASVALEIRALLKVNPEGYRPAYN